MIKIDPDKLRAALKRKGEGATVVSVKAGLSRTYVSDLLSKPDTDPRINKLRKLTTYLGCDIEDISIDTNPAWPPKAEVRTAEVLDEFKPRLLPKDVPVQGTAAGNSLPIEGLNGDAFQIHTGEPMDYVRRPPAIAARRGVYAIYHVGYSMEPRFRAGELSYIDPDRPPRLLDDVLIQIVAPLGEDEEVVAGIVKTLIKRDDQRIVVAQYNPAKEFEIAMERVKGIHRIIPWAELMG